MEAVSSNLDPNRPPPLFALIIGINKYLDDRFPDLTVAVRDADAIDHFLTASMGVPSENIVNLRDEEANREAIINAFTSLAEITKDESAILIYYAGHGGRSPVPLGEEWEYWETDDSMIEVLCPADMGLEDCDGSEIQGIPDRTISILLNNLAAAKGDNITFILDCCSSAGINREYNIDDNEDDTIMLRMIPKPPKISVNCDRKIWEHRVARTTGVMQGFSGKHQESHILIAACGKHEAALELKGKHGAFTGALLGILEKGGISELTYTSLMHKLKIPRHPKYPQTPHCEGHHVHRRLFNKNATGADSSFVLGRHTKDGDKSVTIQAGAAQGLILHSKFSIHRSNIISEANPELGSLELIERRPFESVLAFHRGCEPFHIPSTFYAKETERGPHRDFGVYCSDRAWLEAILPPGYRDQMGITVVESEEASDMCLEVIGGQVFFDRRDDLITPFVGSRFPHTVEKDQVVQIHRVLKCAIHFNHHLIRTGTDFRQVSMEFRKLGVSVSEGYEPISRPEGANLIEEEPATIIVDERARFGLTIYNESEHPLYPYLFYFDPFDLMIMSWYLSPFGAGVGNLSQVDAPLPSKGKLTIGYGSGGAYPWQFLLRDGEDIDIGFFKLFLTTKPTDFSTIRQNSPFGETSLSRDATLRATPDYEAWGVKMATVVQRRHEADPAATL